MEGARREPGVREAMKLRAALAVWLGTLARVFASVLSYKIPFLDLTFASLATKLPIVVFVAFLGLYWITRGPETWFNEQTRQAVAFLHGHADINGGGFIEVARVDNRMYALHPPLAAVLMMPLAAIWGEQAPQGKLAIFLGALDVALACQLFLTLGLSTEACVWLTVFFGLGTIFWSHPIDGNTWAMPMIVAVGFTFAALIEVFGQARPLWLGILVALAALARYDLALTIPVFMGLAFLRGRSLRELLWMAPGLTAALLGFVAFNEVRYGTWFDVGVSVTGPHGGPAFSPLYIPARFYEVFFLAPGLDAGTFPYFKPLAQGQSLTLTSPAFALALRPSFRRPEVVLLALAVVLGSIPSLLCYTGGLGFGARHFIQVFPFLIAMMALGMPKPVDQLSKILIGLSVALVGLGLWRLRISGFA